MKAHCGKCGQFFVCKCPESPPIIEYGPVPGDSLTFAEAMALNPSEVECQYCRDPNGSPWVDSEKWQRWSIHDLREAAFRRSRPKRSRVEEMAAERLNWDLAVDGDAHALLRRFGDKVVRAVCEYLRSHPTQAHRGHAISCDIERHFLEPR